MRRTNRLREVERPWTNDGYRELATAYLQGRQVEGWEGRASVIERLSGTLEALGNSTAVAVGHGLSLSLWLSSKVEGLDAVALWTGLQYPDAIVFQPQRQSLLLLRDYFIAS